MTADALIAEDDFVLYVDDVRDRLPKLPTGSVDCCVTSPPYWGLRDYGSAGQIGLEPTPEAYVAAMVEVFGEVRRVLKPSGTLWLNLGDSYASPIGGNNVGLRTALFGAGNERGKKVDEREMTRAASSVKKNVPGLKQKDLCGIPWRVAFALQADGWYLRSDIIWSKPNPMPESVTDRPTKSHEYVFLLSKSPRYFFDQEAVREKYQDGPGLTGGAYAPPGQSPHSNARGPDGRRATRVLGANGSIQHRDGERWPNGGRNVRSVWEIVTQPYPDAHFATFPEELPRRCILAGCPEFVCGTCGKPRERIVKRTAVVIDRSARTHDKGHTRSSGTMLEPATAETVGWSDCGHDNWQRGVVLDPFMGSGTTAKVARDHGRKAIGIEQNPEYAALCDKRNAQRTIFAEDAA